MRKSILALACAGCLAGCASTQGGLNTAAQDVGSATKAVVQTAPNVIGSIATIGGSIVRLLLDLATVGTSISF